MLFDLGALHVTAEFLCVMSNSTKVTRESGDEYSRMRTMVLPSDTSFSLHCFGLARDFKASLHCMPSFRASLGIRSEYDVSVVPWRDACCDQIWQ